MFNFEISTLDLRAMRISNMCANVFRVFVSRLSPLRYNADKINLLAIGMRARRQFSPERPSGLKHPPRDNYLDTRGRMSPPFRY